MTTPGHLSTLLEKRHSNFKTITAKYDSVAASFCARQIQNIIFDNKVRIVTAFKENLIWNEPIEVLSKYPLLNKGFTR